MAPISTRVQLAALLNDRGLRGEAVEVGTHLGEFADAILRRWDGRRLWCVDPWTVPPGYEEQAATLWGGGTRESHYAKASRTLRGHGDRCAMLRMTSEEAVARFPDEGLDFVYLDGDHRLDHVWHDVHGWWPKLRPGGILAGHDWLLPGEPPGTNWGGNVQPVVTGFADKQRLDCWLVVEEGGLPWTWYVVKKPWRP